MRFWQKFWSDRASLSGQGRSILPVLFLAITLSSCLNTKKIIETPDAESKSCTIKWTNYQAYEQVNTQEVLQDTLLSSRFSREGLLAANAIGLVDELRKLQDLESQMGTDTKPGDALFAEHLALQVKISYHLDLFQSDVDALDAVLKCEKDNMHRITETLKTSNAELDKKLTLGAILTGAAVALVTGSILLAEDNAGVDPGNAVDYVGLVGGTVGVYLGVGAMNVNRRVRYDHATNYLQMVYRDSIDARLIPSSILYFLKEPEVYPHEGNWLSSMERSWNNRLKMTYKNEKEFLAGRDLIFSEGGIYDVESLSARDDIMEEFIATIGLMNNYLNSLALELMDSP